MLLAANSKCLCARMLEASALASELMALVEAIADPDMTVGLSYVAKFIKMETGEYADVLRWSQTVIELADGDPTKGNFLIGSPLAFAHATRAVARGGLGYPLAEVLPALPVAAAMSRATDPTTHAMVIAFTYGLGIAIKVLLADDAALELIDEALQIAERSADDFALNLVGAGIDRQNQRVAYVAFHVVFGRVTVATHHLHALERDTFGDFGGLDLGH